MTRRIAIFGATSDIAVAVARIYAEQGAALVLVGRDPAALSALANDLTVRGASQAMVDQADLAQIGGLAAVAGRAWDALGGLDIALVAHGSLPEQSAVQDDPSKVGDAIVLNFASAAALCAALSPRFEAARAGGIAVITSVAGDRGRQSNYVYGAAKGGLQRFLEGLRHRMHPAGVQVLDIRPGFVSTRMTAHLASGPLWASPQSVARDIVRALARGEGVLYTPWFWAPIMFVVRALPSAVFHRSRL